MNRARCAYAAIVVLFSLCCKTAAAISWFDGPGYRSAEVHPGTGRSAGFTLMDPKETGVGFTNLLQGDAYLTNAVAHNGSGVAIGDVDGDGWADIKPPKQMPGQTARRSVFELRAWCFFAAWSLEFGACCLGSLLLKN